MTTKKNLVKSMLMSILTAGIFGFAFAFTACSDDELFDNAMAGEVPGQGDYANYEPYGLTYHNFDNADDVQILNADTTEIAVRKSLADKLGITNFENHPIGIWDSPSHKAYGRKGMEPVLEGVNVYHPDGTIDQYKYNGEGAKNISFIEDYELTGTDTWPSTFADTYQYTTFDRLVGWSRWLLLNEEEPSSWSPNSFRYRLPGDDMSGIPII